MAGTAKPAPTQRRSTGWRALVSSYRARLFLAIILVVAVALGLVLVSLPRLLEGFFLDQEEANLRTRADAVATLAGRRAGRGLGRGRAAHPAAR